MAQCDDRAMGIGVTFATSSPLKFMNNYAIIIGEQRECINYLLMVLAGNIDNSEAARVYKSL